MAEGEMRSVKLVTLGAANVGKSSLVEQFIHDEFTPGKPPTIGAAFVESQVDLPAGPIKLHLWDTAGEEKYKALAPMYYRAAAGACLVFDLTDHESLSRAYHWFQELQSRGPSEMVITLVGNKADLKENREVEREEALEMLGDAKRSWPEANITYTEASARTGEGVRDMWVDLVSRCAEVDAGRAMADARRGTLAIDDDNKLFDDVDDSQGDRGAATGGAGQSGGRGGGSGGGCCR